MYGWELVRVSRADGVRLGRLVDSVTAEKARKVLRHDRYWTPGFLQRYLARCDRDRVVDPEGALALVEPLVPLMDRVRFPSEAVEGSFRLIALALGAEVLALNGEHRRGVEALERARVVMSGGRVHRLAAAGYFRHGAVVSRLGGCADRAGARLGRCIELYRGVDGAERLGLAEALTLLGGGTPDGLVGLAEALYWVRPRSRDGFRRALFDRAWGPLHDGISGSGMSPEAAGACLAWLRSTDKKWFVRRPVRPPRVRLRWTKGLLLHRLGMDRLACKRLGWALRDAGRLGMWQTLVLVSLDLAAVLMGQQERHRAREVLAESAGLVAGAGLEDWLARAARAEGLTELEAIRRKAAARFDSNP